MTDITEFHARALDATGRIVDGVAADRWHAATPCADWDARGLVNHLVAGNLWAAELAAGGTIEGVGSRLDGDLLGDGPAAAYAASASAAAAVFRRPGALDAPCAVSYGPVPGSVYAGHRFLDVLVHGWDLAVATALAELARRRGAWLGDDITAMTLIDQAERFLPEMVTNARLSCHSWDAISTS
jgi:uncharacterized protein (TIGR03086 family)